MRNSNEKSKGDYISKKEIKHIPGKLSIVMPGYNEGEHIYRNLLLTSKIISKISSKFEIIFVNDGSTDNTLQKAYKASESDTHIKVYDYEKNHGKGNALKAGVEEASGDYIAFLDSDLELNPSQLLDFFNVMRKANADAVIGSKMHPNSKTDYPRRRKIISTGYYIGLRLLFRLKVKDTQTGIKLFKSDAIKPVMRVILVKRFAYDIEVLAILNNSGYKIVEAPIQLSFSRGQKWGRIKFKDIVETLKDTLAIFYRLYILKYYKVSEQYVDKKDEVKFGAQM